MSFPEPQELPNLSFILPISFIVGFGISFLIWVIPIIRKKTRIRKRVKKYKEHFWKRINIPFPDYNKSQKDKDKIIKLFFNHERLKNGKINYAYCDFCGEKILDGMFHDTQKCLINKYSHVVIK